ncbi:MAG: carbohydrate kinase, partial [Cyanobacteria bacterium J083]
MHYLGIDFGTSGARGMLLEQAGIVKAEVRVSFSQAKSQNLASLWQKTLEKLLYQIPSQLRKKTKRIAINGTSATVILCDKQGNPLDEPILYNDNRGIEILADLQTIVPANSVALSATSSLAKLVWWERKGITQPASYFLHQADWLAFLLHGKLGISDYHNALKLGYDVENLTYPNWLENLAIRRILPEIVEPGSPIATIKPEIRHQFAFPADCLVCAGTTDSIAAFIASGAKLPGEAVTSLGSTLVLKLLSQKKIEDVTAGIYSHRLGDLWLTGGASNTGGAVLQHFFSDQQLIELSRQINPAIPTKLDYYPLLTPGERFPWNDP